MCPGMGATGCLQPVRAALVSPRPVGERDRPRTLSLGMRPHFPPGASRPDADGVARAHAKAPSPATEAPPAGRPRAECAGACEGTRSGDGSAPRWVAAKQVRRDRRPQRGPRRVPMAIGMAPEGRRGPGNGCHPDESGLAARAGSARLAATRRGARSIPHIEPWHASALSPRGLPARRGWGGAGACEGAVSGERSAPCRKAPRGMCGRMRRHTVRRRKRSPLGRG